MTRSRRIVRPRSRARSSSILKGEAHLRLLRGFKEKTAADLDGTMTVAAQPLSDDDIVSLVHFLASLGPEP